MRPILTLQISLLILALVSISISPCAAQEHGSILAAAQVGTAGYVQLASDSRPERSGNTLPAMLRRFKGVESGPAKYGYDFYSSGRQSGANSNLRIRGGVSEFSRKAAAGVQVILDW